MKYYYIARTMSADSTVVEHTFFVDVEVDEHDTAKTIYAKLASLVGDELQKLGKERTRLFTFSVL